MTKPRRLQKGSTIRVVSPASGMWARSELWRGIEGLEALGFKVQAGKNAYLNRHYLAGGDAERASDLMEAFLDPEVDAVFCSQGGYGSARLFRSLDFDAIAANPKPFLGYSDITSLHLMLGRLSGLVTFHGPSASGFEKGYLTEYTRKAWEAAMQGDAPLGSIEMADPNAYLLKVTGGVAEGPIVGGNLTLVCSSLGTPFEVDTRGKILFFEELDTEPWIMDHMLTHLANAGKLRDAAGIVIGECNDCEPRKMDPGFHNQCSFEDLIFELLRPLGKPLIYGLPLGHGKDKATLPLGIEARLDAGAGTLELLETATIAP
ncbi:MAG: LD-carboxypeptidase [Spirochaetes bacterium]|nr:LD-carboxypeptidase [Spirochaetota bacterium]MBU1082245.1 LD-carboxypeptidase [Spirochaetota bacterium]